MRLVQLMVLDPQHRLHLETDPTTQILDHHQLNERLLLQLNVQLLLQLNERPSLQLNVLHLDTHISRHLDIDNNSLPLDTGKKSLPLETLPEFRHLITACI